MKKEISFFKCWLKSVFLIQESGYLVLFLNCILKPINLLGINQYKYFLIYVCFMLTLFHFISELFFANPDMKYVTYFFVWFCMKIFRPICTEM